MNISETLTKLNDVLTTSLAAPETPPAPKTVDMTATEFLAHAQAEVAKAAKEKKEDEKKAKKRIALLQKNVERLAKESWAGSNDKVAVEMFEDDITVASDQSDTTVPLDSAAGKGTQADGSSFAGGGGAQGFSKNIDDLNDKILSMMDPTAAAVTPTEPTSVEAAPGYWPGDVNSPSFMKEGVTKRATVGDASMDWGNDPWSAKR